MQEQGSNMLDAARAALAAGDLDGARARLNAIADDDARAGDAQRLLLEIALRKGEAEDALVHARELERREPDAASTWLGLSRAYEALEDYRAARDASSEALSRDPSNYDAWLLHAHHAVRLGRFEDAVADCRQAQQLDAGRVEAVSNEAAALDKLGRRAEAIEQLEQALRTHDNNKGLWLNLGRLRSNEGDEEAAVHAYERALAIDPAFADAWINLGITHLRRQRPLEALEATRRCLEVSPADRSATALAIIAYQQYGDSENYRALYAFDELIYDGAIEVPAGYDSLDAFNASLVAAVLAHPTLIPEPAGKATRRGQQTGNLLRGDGAPVFAALREQVMRHIERFLARDFKRAGHPYASFTPEDCDLYMWATVLDEQGHQKPHIHPAGWVSGVYYAQVPAGAPDRDEQAGWIEFGQPDIDVPGIDESNTDLRRFEAREGRLYLFPSYFFHRTIPYRGDKPRVSIAFDLVPKRLRRRGAQTREAASSDFEREFASLVRERRLGEAEALCREALQRDERDAAALAAQGQLALMRGALDPAIAALRDAIAIDPHRLAARLALSGALRQQRSHDEAVEVLDAVPEQQSADVLAARAELAIDGGDFERARAALRELRHHSPTHGRAAWLLALLDDASVDVAKLQECLDAAPGRDQVGLQFALARLHERAGRTAQALEVLKRVNAAVHESVAGRSKGANVALLRNAFDRALLQRDAGQRETGAGIVFIVGMPRTGTTLIERVLVAHPQAATAQDTSLLWRVLDGLRRALPAGTQLPRDIARIDPAALAEAGWRTEQALRQGCHGKRVVVARDPGSYPLLGLAQLLLPAAAVIRCRRNVADLRWSCFAHWFDTPMPFAYDLPTLDQRIIEESMLWHHWREALAMPTLEIDYDEFVANPQAGIDRLARFCGVAPDPEMRRFDTLPEPVLHGDRIGVRFPVYETSVGRGAAFGDVART